VGADLRLRRLAAAAADPGEWLAGANEAFSGWGDAATYAWAFRAGADLLYLDGEDGRPVAGSALTYRTLTGAVPAAVMTGSWTLPAARRRGAFGRLLAESQRIAGERGAVLLGFGRRDNPSRRGFETAGATLHPTFYCRSTRAPLGAEPLDALAPDPARFPRAGTGFVYDEAGWRAQFLARPGAGVDCLGRDGDWAALVEPAAGFDRVHAATGPRAYAPLAARAHAAGRRLFVYTTEAATAQALAGLGFEHTEGCLYVLPPSAITDWSFANGDRM
jgi:hypothetical protein